MTKSLFTIGDSMIVMNPVNTGPLRFNHTFERTLGGAELNVAIAASRLGLNTTFYSKIGSDEFGKFVINTLRGEGINTDYIELCSDNNTSVYFKQINADGTGKSFYYRDNAPIKKLNTKDVLNIDLSNIDYLHISGVFVALLNEKIDVIQQLLSNAKKLNIQISLDPNIRLKTWNIELATKCLTSLFPYIDTLIASDDELEQLNLSEHSEEFNDLFEQYNINEIIIKRGASATRYYGQNQYYEIDTFEMNVIDTVGAGDGFSAAYIFAKSKNYSIPDRLRFANAVGGMVTQVKGDNEGLPYLEEVEDFLSYKKTIER